MQKRLGKLIVIVAPSGTGKSTMIKRLKKDFPTLEESVSFTTRPIRPGEVHGESYYFVSKDEFQKMIVEKAFLEWANVHGNFYGTSKKVVDNAIIAGKHLLFDLDVQGTDAMKAYFNDRARAIFIAPPSVEELEKRLRNRGTETTEVINVRLMNARNELLRKNDYDYLVFNDNIEEAYEQLKSITNSILNN